ncbi:hypothetical protein [Edaphobacter modestus]|uniref:Uncharacterized protein n=1 Tax=Edaphobacter modestus TaxID=388466 RepID=A0A4Q7YRM2_9BACT|nr:hypothetical protein [Edaphobacter modestus]RZU40158.1 hypothetical protein BDD14_1591 [Edaphobacter modestus]
MMPDILNRIRTIELIAWDFDEYKSRPESIDRERPVKARELVVRRQSDHSSSALCEEETRLLRDTLVLQQSRLDLHAEMVGLDWSLGVVDLRRLLAFQRRLSFNSTLPAMTVPPQYDWDRLIEIAFASPNPVICDVLYDTDKKTVILQSSNPNVQLRVTQDPAAPVAVYAGSPFLEVAQYAGRWFLRDGYHRAYMLLRAGIFQIPAVIVRVRTLEELGAVQPQFFSEAILLSEHPPFVSDFLNDALTIEYERHPIIKTLRITMEESITFPLPIAISGEQP